METRAVVDMSWLVKQIDATTEVTLTSVSKSESATKSWRDDSGGPQDNTNDGVDIIPDQLSIVDVRDAWEFEEIGHIPEAVNIPFDSFRNETGDTGMLPGRENWEDILTAAGITETDDIVAYDDMHGVFAARFLLTAEVYGHPPEHLHLLNGDYSAWNQLYKTISGTGVESANSSAYQATAKSDVSSSPLVGYETVQTAIDDPTAVLLDTRDRSEYESGHLPGAINLDWRAVVDDETRGLKSPGKCKDVFNSIGITSETHVVLYCNTARRISHTYMILHSLGYTDIDFYEGSLSDWRARDGAIETEDAD
ncbi:sulfurtransferase [Haloquadratum walsbyi]|nr:rhodanese-like domain-containing protein [Haloquadratum walsbyi]